MARWDLFDAKDEAAVGNVLVEDCSGFLELLVGEDAFRGGLNFYSE